MLTIKTELKASALHGIGLFTAQRIPAGTVVWRFDPLFDLHFPDAAYEAAPPVQKHHIDYYGFLSKATREHIYSLDDSRFMNHSDAPNMIVTYGAGQGEPTMVARRDIAPGEEITVNYHDLCHADDIALAYFKAEPPASVRSIGPRPSQRRTEQDDEAARIRQTGAP
ncbi:MAG: SET domain-containing protein [Micropepsaceae bacterium]